jgi:thioesterase domain-containing protein
VHTLGGGVFGYAPLAQLLGDDQPFYGLEALPEEAHDPMRKDMRAIAQHYVRAMRSVQPHGPYHLGGYSFGATLAYEVACQLVAQGETVGLLALFDHAAPKSDYYQMPRLSWQFVKGFAGNLSHWLQDFLQIPLREQLGRVRRKLLIGQQPAPKNGSIDLSRYIDDVSLVPQEFHALIRSHLAAWEGYTLKPYPGRVTVFYTQRQPLICSYDPHMAWDSLAMGGVEMVPVSGNHRNLLTEPHVQTLAHALKQSLDRAAQSVAPGALFYAAQGADLAGTMAALAG